LTLAVSSSAFGGNIQSRSGNIQSQTSNNSPVISRPGNIQSRSIDVDGIVSTILGVFAMLP